MEQLTEEQRKMIVLGQEAEAFVQSDLGQYLISRCDMDAEAAMEELALVSPDNTNKIRHYQNIIQMNRMFRQWLSEAALASDIAYSEYVETEH